MNRNRIIHRRIPAPLPPNEAAIPAEGLAPAAPGPDHVRDPEGLVTPAAAARRLSVSPKVLERWRSDGDGPAFVRFTSKTIRYRLQDVDAFVAERTMPAGQGNPPAATSP